MRKLNHNGQPLNSTYKELRKRPVDYAERDSRSFSAELGKVKPGWLARFIAFLTVPVEV